MFLHFLNNITTYRIGASLNLREIVELGFGQFSLCHIRGSFPTWERSLSRLAALVTCSLLEQLELADCIVSIDSMGCLHKIAKQIKECNGEHVKVLNLLKQEKQPRMALKPGD
jgi:hypothetical protein